MNYNKPTREDVTEFIKRCTLFGDVYKTDTLPDEVIEQALGILFTQSLAILGLQ